MRIKRISRKCKSRINKAAFNEIKSIASEFYKTSREYNKKVCVGSTKTIRSHIPESIDVIFQTPLGYSIVGPSDIILRRSLYNHLKGTVQLVLTSPPFPLNKEKKYGNLKNDNYKRWLKRYSLFLKELLTPSGSIVLEMGNVWEQGLPAMSTLPMETLLEFKKASNLYLCQEFIWYNPAKLPTPSYWVSIKRSRVKDAFTRFWWLSPTPNPKADNRNVLVPYSGAMKKLLRTRNYNHGTRPSEHRISPTSFLGDNGGSIPPNVLFQSFEPESMIVTSNTAISLDYKRYCMENSVPIHPARMPIAVAKFFISLCTDPGDTVLDPFGGSNTTGAAAEELGRKWITIELNESYAVSGVSRFANATRGLIKESTGDGKGAGAAPARLR